MRFNQRFEEGAPHKTGIIRMSVSVFALVRLVKSPKIQFVNKEAFICEEDFNVFNLWSHCY